MLAQEMTASGRWLFRWRSYMPLLLIPLLAAGLLVFRYPRDSHSLDLWWEGLCLSVSLLGLLVRILTVGFVAHGSSGRATKSLRAETFNSSGMYSIVRHPLYVGNFLVALGVLLDVGPWYIVAIGSLIYWLYYERIMLAEEEVVETRHGDQYRDWAAATPAFLPRFRQWRPPALAFSLKTVIRREYSTLFMIVCVFTVIEVAGDNEVLHRFHFDPAWRIVFFTGLAGYALTRLLVKTTRLLQVPGR